MLFLIPVMKEMRLKKYDDINSTQSYYDYRILMLYPDLRCHPIKFSVYKVYSNVFFCFSRCLTNIYKQNQHLNLILLTSNLQEVVRDQLGPSNLIQRCKRPHLCNVYSCNKASSLSMGSMLWYHLDWILGSLVKGNNWIMGFKHDEGKASLKLTYRF